jgi:hypothetical protein
MKELLKEHKSVVWLRASVILALLTGIVSGILCHFKCELYEAVRPVFAAFIVVFLVISIGSFLYAVKDNELSSSIKFLGGLTLTAVIAGCVTIAPIFKCPCNNECQSKEERTRKFNRTEGMITTRQNIESAVIDEIVKMKIEATQKYRKNMMARTKYLIDSLGKDCNNQILKDNIDNNLRSIEETTQPNY